jgi:hypothetical protein
MSEPKRTGWAHGSDRRVVAGTAVLVACLAAVAAMLTAGAAARSATLPVNASPPTISGIPVVGETLTASEGSWTGAPFTLTHRWVRCGADGGLPDASNCTTIGGATATSYVVVGGDVGFTLRVVETATNADGAPSAASAPTAVVTTQTAPVNTAEPLISGSAVEGSTLSTSTGTWTGTSITYTYRWLRCDTSGGLPDASNCPSIPGATSSSYTLGAADIGQRLRAQVTASNAKGTATATANPTDVVQQSTTSGPPRNLVEPSISGTFAVGRILSGSLGTWAGATPLSYAYQWVRCGTDGGLPDGSNCAPISNATTSIYTLTVDDVGQRIRIRITASNSLGTQTAASNASAVVTPTSSTTPAPRAPLNTVLPAILGSATVGTTLTASVGLWTGTTPLLYSYQWLRCGPDGGQPSGAGCSAISGATGTQFTLASADLGQRLRVQVTARNTLGTATATSNATAQVQAAGSTPTPTPTPPPTPGLPPGAIRLPDGKVSIPVTSVSLPERLVATQILFTPNPVRSRARPLELRVRVFDTRGYVVRDAVVFARSTPLLTSAPGEQTSGRDGWARLRMTLHADFPLGGGRNVQFWVRVRKPSDELLAGVSNRRLVQVATAAG